MNYSKPWQSYRQVSAETASPGQLVIMLYDGAIRFLEQALTGFNYDDPLEFNLTISNNLKKTREGIEEGIRHLSVLRDAWREMLANAGNRAAEAENVGLSACC
jgi:flagellar protein FliS